MKITLDLIQILIIVISFNVIYYLQCKQKNYLEIIEKMTDQSNTELLDKHRKEGDHFPYRYLGDENGKIIPIVLVAAFFRDNRERNMYTDYINKGIKVAGITAYKSFPRPITDKSGDSYYYEDSFDYLGNIKNWFSCFRNPEHYGFNKTHNIIDYSESDFYDIDQNEPVEKKYDFIYVCNNDADDHCPMDGWNAINRNFKLALDCFPIIINEFKLKVLVIGRLNCGLEQKYGDMIEVSGFLPYHEFQDKMRQSRFLFVPNIYDASPRVVTEAITKDIPVLMNYAIVCGSKYINQETGEFFNDENDIRLAIKNLLAKKDKISPKKWWEQHYSRQKAGVNFRNFLHKQYPEILENVKEVHFI